MIRAVFIWFALATMAFAVEPEEILADPVLEERAREISKGVRCLVCRNESIDESNAELARDLRILVRERLMEGDTDAEVVDYLVSRFGEYVLLKPRLDGSNLVLWVAGPVLFLLGLGVAGFYIAGRRPEVREELSAEEEAELSRLLRD